MINVTTVDMFGTAPGRGSLLDVLVPDGLCGEDVIAEAAAHARRNDHGTAESALVSECSSTERTFASRIFNTGGETPFGTHSLAGVAALLVSAGHLAPGEVGRTAEAGCQWSWTDGRAVEVPFTGPVVHQEIPHDPAMLGPYAGIPHAGGVGRAFNFVRVTEDPRALPVPDLGRMEELGLTDLTLFRWDPGRQEVLARVFAPGFGIPEDSGCLPAAAALGVTALHLGADGQVSTTVRHVTSHGAESVFRCTGSIRDGAATVRVTGQVWVGIDENQEASE
jgi:trans-2,3-dihydro-3-hydroxyanthranilate isomerase